LTSSTIDLFSGLLAEVEIEAEAPMVVEVAVMMKGIEGYRFKYTREWHDLTSTSCSNLILSTKLVRFIYDTITNNERVSRHYKSKKGPMSVCVTGNVE